VARGIDGGSAARGSVRGHVRPPEAERVTVEPVHGDALRRIASRPNLR
jgi:hypothetical protein